MTRNRVLAVLCLLTAGGVGYVAFARSDDWPPVESMRAANGRCEDVTQIHGEVGRRMIAYTFAIRDEHGVDAGVIQGNATVNQPVKLGQSVVVLFDPEQPVRRNWAGIGDPDQTRAAYTAWRDERASELRIGRISGGALAAILFFGSVYFAVQAVGSKPSPAL